MASSIPMMLFFISVIMKMLLLPHWLRIPGWVMFVLGMIAGGLLYLDMLTFTGVAETVVNDVTIIGLALGGLFIVCSREREEDEMTGSIRLAAMLNALYVYIALLVIYTLFVDGVAYFYFMSVNLVLFPVLFVILFRLEIYHNDKLSANEESR